MKYIGIDLGSSFIKAVLLDLDERRMVANKKCPSPKREKNENPNVFEIPAQGIVDIVRGLIDGYTVDYKDIEGVIISTQMHGFVYSVPERADTYVSWQDMRCMDSMPGTNISYLQWLESQITSQRMQDNGVYLKPSLAVCNLYTLLEENRDLPRDGNLYTLGSYMIYALTGNNICHISNAAPLGIADVAHGCWDHSLLIQLGLGKVRLPRLAESDYEVCGKYVSNGCTLKIHPDYGDMQVSILGSSIGDGDVAVNVATGAQVLLYSKDFIPGELYEIRPYFNHSYLNTISNMPAGRNLDVLVNFLCETVRRITGIQIEAQDVWKVVHSEIVEKNEELKVETSFYKNPHFPDGGAIRGITHSNLHLGTLFRAAFEDMAETYWKYIQKLGVDTETIKRIVCAGGVNWKTPELRQIIGQVTGKPCELSPMADEALSGMYQLSMVCSGKCAEIGECRRYPLQQ